MAHRKHAKTSQLLWCVEYYRREAAWHLGIEAYLDTCLYLVLTLDKQVKKLLCVNHCLSEVCHQADQSRVPFVGYLGESCGAARH